MLGVNDLAAEGVALSLVAQLVQVVALGLRGPGRVPAARGRAVALRVEPLSKAQRLAPDGLPSVDGVQDFDRCALDDLVLQRGHAQRALARPSRPGRFRRLASRFSARGQRVWKLRPGGGPRALWPEAALVAPPEMSASR